MPAARPARLLPGQLETLGQPFLPALWGGAEAEAQREQGACFKSHSRSGVGKARAALAWEASVQAQALHHPDSVSPFMGGGVNPAFSFLGPAWRMERVTPCREEVRLESHAQDITSNSGTPVCVSQVSAVGLRESCFTHWCLSFLISKVRIIVIIILCPDRI